MKNSIGPVDIEFALKNINFQAEAEKMKQGIRGVTTTAQQEAAKTANSFKGGFGGIDKMLNGIGLNISGLIGPAAGVAAAFKFKQLAQEAYEFEMAYGMAMREVQTISKAVQDDFEGISQSIVDLAANGPDDAITLAKAYYQIVSAGQDGAAGLELLSVASKAATAGVTDTLTAADGLTTVINAWGLSADHANEIADVMFKTVERGKTTFAQLAANIAQVATLASANGIGLNEIFAAIQSITKQGTPTAQAMTQIRSSIINMNNALGDGWSKTMTYQEGLNKIAEMAGGSQVELKKLIPDVEGMSAVLALTGEKAKGAAEDLNETTKAAGAMETAYGRMMEEADNKWSVVHNKWMREVRELGKAMKEESGNLANFMDALLSSGADVKEDMPIYGIADKIKALRIMGGSFIGSYIKGGLMPESVVREQYDQYVKTIQNYASQGLSQQQIKLSDILGIKDKDERLTKLNEFLVSMKTAEQDLGNTVFKNDEQQKAALKIRADLWGEMEAKATSAIKAITEAENAKGGGGTDAKVRDLKVMTEELKKLQDSFGTGSAGDAALNLAKQSALKQEIQAYYDKIRELVKVDPVTKLQTLSAKETLGGIQTITKEQTKQEFQGEKLLKQSKAKTTEAQKQADAIKEQNDEYMQQAVFFEGLTTKLGDAAEILGAMSYAVGEFDSTLGESVGKMADLANNAANMVASYAAGDFVGAIASGIGVVGNIIGLAKSNKEDPTVKALENVNNLLKTQSVILANLNEGESYFDLAAKQISDYTAAIDLNTASLRGALTEDEKRRKMNLVRPVEPGSPGQPADPLAKAQYKADLAKYNKDLADFQKNRETLDWTPEQFVAAYANGSLILDEQQIAWVTEITEKQRARAELLQETFRRALGFDASELSDSIMQGIQDGLKLADNGLGDFTESFGDQVKKALIKGITDAMQLRLTEGFLTDMTEFLKSESEGGKTLTPGELALLEAEYAKSVKEGTDAFNAVKPIFDKYGAPTSSAAAAVTGITASLTEDTASALVGQLMAVRTDVKDILKQVAMGQDDVSRNLLYLKEIAQNTSHNVRLIKIEEGITEMNRTLKDRL